MKKEQYREYLASEAWQIRRRWALDHANDRCQVCYSDGPLNVHHRTYVRVGRERLADLTVLCADCHGRFHDKIAQAPDAEPNWPDLQGTAAALCFEVIHGPDCPAGFDALFLGAMFRVHDDVLQVQLRDDLSDYAFAHLIQNMKLFATMMAQRVGFKIPWQMVNEHGEGGAIMWGTTAEIVIEDRRPA